MMSPAASHLPALSEHRWLRFLVFTIYYVVQGLPIGFAFVALPAYMLSQGVDVAKVSYLTSIAGLPWAFKLVSGPVMDLVSFTPMGTRRPWILGAQFGILIVASGLLFISDLNADLIALTIICTGINAFAAIQDVAVDGMAITILQEEERGRANAFMAAGQVAGTAVTGSLVTKLLNAYGLPGAGAFLVLTLLVMTVLTLLVRERPGERILPWSEGEPHPDAPVSDRKVSKLFVLLFRAIILPMSLLLVLVEVLFRVSMGLKVVWFPNLAIQGLGYLDTQWVDWFAISGVVAAIVGVFYGPVIDRLGPKKAMSVILLANGIAYIGVYLFRDFLGDPIWGISALFVLELAGQLLFVSVIAIFMYLCHVRIAATQFAIYMAFANLGRSAGVGLYPQFKEWFGMNEIFLTSAAIYLLCWVLLMRFDLVAHQRKLNVLFEPSKPTE